MSGRCTAGCLLAGLALAGPATGEVPAPVLKWQHGGCYASWCETGWYASPAVADLDGDGAAEVIGSAYSIVVLDGATGALRWRVASGHDRTEPGAGNVGRTWPGIVVADVDGDGELDIATAHGGGWLSLYDRDGFFAPGWPQRPATSELRGLGAADLDGDGDLELVASAALSSGTNTWAFEHDGGLRPGWPQRSAGTPGYSWGVFNDNVAIGDVDGDGSPEVVVPSDVHYICAYEPDGSPIPAHSMYGGKVWGEVGVWESPATELQGWGTCDLADGREQRNRTNFAHGPVSLADLDGDGGLEVVAAGNTYDCAASPYESLYSGVFLFRGDRSRFVAPGFDWRTVPLDTGAPLSEDYDVIESAHPNPVPADLDGDGVPEILFPSYDGRLHAFWLDQSEHGAWPYSVYQPAEGFYRFASEPVVADLDGDGLAEVLFTSWTEKGSAAAGRLHVVDHLGQPLHEVVLPASLGSSTWNGALAAPTLADLDADPDLEIVLQTAFSGLVAYDLPGSAGALPRWPTGRGSQTRAGRSEPGAGLFADGFESGDVSRWSSSVP